MSGPPQELNSVMLCQLAEQLISGPLSSRSRSSHKRDQSQLSLPDKQNRAPLDEIQMIVSPRKSAKSVKSGKSIKQVKIFNDIKVDKLMNFVHILHRTFRKTWNIAFKNIQKEALRRQSLIRWLSDFRVLNEKRKAVHKFWVAMRVQTIRLYFPRYLRKISKRRMRYGFEQILRERKQSPVQIKIIQKQCVSEQQKTFIKKIMNRCSRGWQKLDTFFFHFIQSSWSKVRQFSSQDDALSADSDCAYLRLIPAFSKLSQLYDHRLEYSLKMIAKSIKAKEKVEIQQKLNEGYVILDNQCNTEDNVKPTQNQNSAKVHFQNSQEQQGDEQNMDPALNLEIIAEESEQQQGKSIRSIKKCEEVPVSKDNLQIEENEFSKQEYKQEISSKKDQTEVPIVILPSEQNCSTPSIKLIKEKSFNLQEGEEPKFEQYNQTSIFNADKIQGECEPKEILQAIKDQYLQSQSFENQEAKELEPNPSISEKIEDIINLTSEETQKEEAQEENHTIPQSSQIKVEQKEITQTPTQQTKDQTKKKEKKAAKTVITPKAGKKARK